MTNTIFPDLKGVYVGHDGGLLPRTECHGWRTGRCGVTAMAGLADGTVTFVAFYDRTIAVVAPRADAVAFYPVPQLSEAPPAALFVDLDGTLLDSEPLWVSVIEKTIAEVANQPGFRFLPEAIAYVSGRSVGAHLAWALHEYAPDIGLTHALQVHARLTRDLLARLESGNAADEAPLLMSGFDKLLAAAMAEKLPVALVTSGVQAKMWPTLTAALRRSGHGDPAKIFSAILCGGTAAGESRIGSLSDLPMKPHPWLYSEARVVGLGLPETAPGIAIEDSAAGVVAARLAGLTVIGLSTGNIAALGGTSLCAEIVPTLEDAALAVRARTNNAVPRT